MGNHQLVIQRPLGNGVSEIQATIDGYPDWEVRAVVTPTTSGSVISSLAVVPVYPAVEANLPPDGLPARAVRKINPGELVDLARARAAEMRGSADLMETYGSGDARRRLTRR